MGVLARLMRLNSASRAIVVMTLILVLFMRQLDFSTRLSFATTHQGTNDGVDDTDDGNKTTGNTIGPLHHQCPENFIYLEDREADVTKLVSMANNSHRRIPLVLYQTSRSRCIPSELYEESVSKWLDFGWGYRFYDDAAMDAYLADPKWEQIFPGLAHAIRCINHAHKPVMKADLWRYLVLFENGGVFADLDVIPSSNFTAETTLHANYDAAFVSVHLDTGHHLSQWFLAVSPRHPLMYLSLMVGLNLTLASKRANPIMTTGPRALYWATDKFFAETADNQVNTRLLEENRLYSSNVTAILKSTVRGGNEGSSSNEADIRSFVVLPRDIAQNRATQSKQGSYQKMNMTQYSSRGGKVYGGIRCRNFSSTLHHY